MLKLPFLPKLSSSSSCSGFTILNLETETGASFKTGVVDVFFFFLLLDAEITFKL